MGTRILKLCLLLLLSISYAAETKKDSLPKVGPLFNIDRDTLDPLEKKIADILDSSQVLAKFGMSVYSHQRDSMLHQFNANVLFTPASTLKILVTSTALDQLDLNFHPKTELKLFGTQHRNKFSGRLVIEGFGDPNLSSRYFTEETYPLLPWIDSLKSMGIDTIEGTMNISTAFFPGPQKPTTWKKEFFNSWYGAEVSALSFNDNCIQFEVHPTRSGKRPRVEVLPNVPFFKIVNKAKTYSGKRDKLTYSLDSLENILYISGKIGTRARPRTITAPVKKPENLILYTFKNLLDSHNIVFKPSANAVPEKIRKTFTITTAPLLSMLDEINQRSQNLHAEILLRQIASARYGKGSVENGLKAEREWLDSIGISSDDFIILDGSGLSYGNKVTPVMMTKVLNHMLDHSKKDLFIRSLAQPGISGVSGKRMRNLKTKHLVRYKTGFVNFTQGLVGYVFSTTGDTLSVSIYMNDYNISDWKASRLMDTLWTTLTDHYTQEYESLVKAKAALRSLEYKNGSFDYKLDYFSRHLLETPYLLGPTGEGAMGLIEPDPLINFEAFDCVTYIESVLALAYSKSENEILPNLNKIRYFNGHISYTTRKHYFMEDWVLQSPEIVKIIRFDGDSTGTRTMDKIGFYKNKNITYEGTNPETTIHFLPTDKAIAQFKEKYQGKNNVIGVGFIGKYPKIWATHTGLVILKKGEVPLLRHASSKSKKAVELPLYKYLESRKGKSIGATFFDFVPPEKVHKSHETVQH